MPAASINTRQRLLEFIKSLSEQEVTALARQLLPEVSDEAVDISKVPHVFTEEESRARLTQALDEVAQGKTRPWPETRLELDRMIDDLRNR